MRSIYQQDMPPSICLSGASIRLAEMRSDTGPGEAPPKLNDLDEADLVARLRTRDKAAFRELVEQYGSRIHRVSCGILRNRAAADEITQNVFAKGYLSIQNFEGRGSLYVWLYRIALNECYGLLRSKQFKHASSRESSERKEGFGIAVARTRATPDRTAVQWSLANKLLARIPEDDRWLLISKDVEGLSLAELSEITGLNEAAIKVRLFTVRQGLVAAMARWRSGLSPSAGGAVGGSTNP
jgi:RNA polymerase sigma-70 factor (ECF subfamily)